MAEGRARDRPERPTRRGRRRRRVRWWGAAAIIVATLLVAEASARAIGPNIERTAGSEERAFLKADQMYRRSGPTDVAILGSSETAGGLVPSVIEQHAPGIDGVYNAALAGTFVDTYRAWADQVVIPALDPKVGVISMLPMTVADIPEKDSPNYLEARAAYDSAFDQITGGQLGSIGWRLRQRSALIRYRPYLRDPATLARGIGRTLRGEEQPTPTAGTGMDWTTETDPAVVAVNTGPDGEVYDYHQESVPTDADPLGAALYREFSKGRFDVAELEAFVDDLRDRSITPAILVLPVDRGPLEAGGVDLATMDGWTEQLVAWADDEGIPIHEEFTRSWASDLFHDRNHLDEAGAQRLSETVGAWLQDECDAGDLFADCSTGS
ncbi:MAG: hypothetical protein R2701_05215 [Acidimicrobiales bacterium]